MLWNDYVSAFGGNDTLGFSIIVDSAHVGQVTAVYGPSPYGSNGSPGLFDVHIYDETGAEFGVAFSNLNAQGYRGVPWIIGEAYYNDATEAAALRQQANSTGQKVLVFDGVALSSGQSCDPNVNVAPPSGFSNYQAQDFGSPCQESRWMDWSHRAGIG
jgi:hypothetical protein